MNHRHNNKKIWKLKKKIKELKQAVDISLDLYEFQKRNNIKFDKERRNFRKIIKYHTLLLVIMSLLYSADGNDDITRIIRSNIMEYYKRINQDMMGIPIEFEDEEFEEEQEIDSEDDNIEIGEEEFW